MSLTVACVLVRGHVGFTPEYVVRLRSMVARYLGRPHRFVCLSDQPLPQGIEALPVRLQDGCRGWWAKVHLFNPELDLGERTLYLDLDTLVVDDLGPVVDYPADMALAADGAPHFRVAARPQARSTGMRMGTDLVKRFNSSVMVWSRGAASDLYTNWTPNVASRLWGDQDWAGEQMPGAAAMPLQWFPRISEMPAGLVPAGAKVVLVKKPKNLDAARRWPWFRQMWG